MIVWPVDLFQAKTVLPQLVGQATTGGRSGSGVSQAVRTDGGGLWRLSFSGIWLRTADQIRAWRAWEAILDGGVTKVVVPFCDLRFAPRPLVSGVPVIPEPDVPHSDGAYFDDDTGYASGLIVAATVGVGALRATTVTLDIITGSALRGGEHFSLEHPTKGWRLYRVRTVDASDGTQQVVTIRPPLREATTDAMPVEFAKPRTVATLADPDGMALPVAMGRTAMTDVAFVESF